MNAKKYRYSILYRNIFKPWFERWICLADIYQYFVYFVSNQWSRIAQYCTRVRSLLAQHIISPDQVSKYRSIWVYMIPIFVFLVIRCNDSMRWFHDSTVSHIKSNLKSNVIREWNTILYIFCAKGTHAHTE